MDKNNLIQLTNSLYKLTLLFPKKEPLRYKMREIADEILNSCLRQNSGQNPVKDDLEVLNGFFEVAKEQNWVQADEILKIQQEYNKIEVEIKDIIVAQEEPKLLEKPKKETTIKQEITENSSPPIQAVTGAINPRQEKIIEFLKENGRAQVWQVKQVFPEVTKRTIRRDFESMLKQGMIQRVGERNDTFYQIKKSDISI